MVEIKIQNNTLKISPYLSGLEDILSFKFTSRPKVKKLIYSRKKGDMIEKLVDGPVRSQIVPLFDKNEDEDAIFTYSGLLSRVENYLNSNEIKYEIIDKNNEVVPIIEDWVFEGLYEDQRIAAEKMLKHRGGCMLDAATSSGKTHVIASICRAYTGHSGLIVTNRQTVASRLFDALRDLCPKSNIGIYTSQRKSDGDTMIITAATLSDYDPREIRFIIYDEAHGASGESRSRDLLAYYRATRYGLSATIENQFSGIHNYLEAIFGPIVHSISDQDVESLGRASPLKVHILDVNEGPSYPQKTSDLTMERHGIWYNRKRNKLIQECVSRIPQDQQTVVFVRTKYHLDHLKEKYLKDFDVFHGGLTGKQKKQMLDGFNSGKIKRILSTDSLAEGVDPSAIFVTINANWSQSANSSIQKAGRNRRLAEGKDFGVVIDFNDAWDPKFQKKSKSRLSKYYDRGYTIFESSTPSSITYCDTNE